MFSRATTATSVFSTLLLLTTTFNKENVIFVNSFNIFSSSVAQQQKKISSSTTTSQQQQQGQEYYDIFGLQKDIHLDIALDIKVPKTHANNEQQSRRFYINKFQLDLTNNPLSLSDNYDDDESIPLMPGVDGSSKKVIANGRLLSGKKQLNIINDGEYIDLKGLQHTNIKNGCWEITWQKHAASGNIICGFTMPKSQSESDDDGDNISSGIKRNDDVIIPSNGSLYISFPIWKVDMLKKYQIIRDEKEKQHNELEKEKQHILTKMDETLNPLMKAKYYHEAIQVTEKQMHINANYYIDNVPPKNDNSSLDLIDIGNNLQLSTFGNIFWMKNPSSDEEQQGHIPYGNAIIKKNKKDMNKSSMNNNSDLSRLRP